MAIEAFRQTSIDQVECELKLFSHIQNRLLVTDKKCTKVATCLIEYRTINGWPDTPWVVLACDAHKQLITQENGKKWLCDLIYLPHKIKSR